MKKSSRFSDIGIILLVFIVSRIIIMLFGIRMNILPLYQYWQYLDVETLKHHLLMGVWYDHAQPPVFNLFLGGVLKIFGSQSPAAFSLFFKIFTLLNGFLLLAIIKKMTTLRLLPLLISLAYLLSPATLIYECELFYTTFISLILLTSVFFLIRLNAKLSWTNTIGFFLPLILLCLTRSVYHFLWLVVITGIFIFYFRKQPAIRKVCIAGILSVLLVGSWYLKNKIIFGKFSASTWIGMNMARNVFHDNEVTDSSRIEAYGSFSKISAYKKFINPAYEKKFQGFNDRDLLQEMKNDSFINENNINYIPISDQYQKASITFIKSHPRAYLENVLQSMIIYFTPATRYSLAEERAAKIKYYDLLYSFNLSHFAEGKQQRRIALTLSAIPKLILYLLVFFVLFHRRIQICNISPWNLLILLTIGFVFAVSSFFEHYENMRFRFETEPLFLILVAQAIAMVYSRLRFRQRRP